MTSLFVRRLSAVLLAVTVTACGSSKRAAPDGVFFPTVPLGNAYPAGEIEGEFQVRSGCLFVARPEDRWLLLWSEGFTARTVDGRIEVLDDEGHVVAREGERIRFGGGETRPREVDGTADAERHATELSGQDVPERCGDLYWLVSPPGS
ncbi:MAG TPA: hypothetical protein VJ913_07025 [Actinomycetota bacterium]|nr:hypothetical protein [Actinomycetota bacterium]